MTVRDAHAAALRILIVGELEAFLTTGARLAAFRELGVEIEGVDSRAFLSTRSALLRTRRPPRSAVSPPSPVLV
jgi:hypothetical protein